MTPKKKSASEAEATTVAQIQERIIVAPPEVECTRCDLLLKAYNLDPTCIATKMEYQRHFAEKHRSVKV